MKKDDAVNADQCAVTAQPLAIIGIGCLFPKADTVSSYWSTIKNGIDAITEIPPTHWSVADYHADDPKAADRTYGRRGGFISPVDFNPLEYGLPPNVLEATDTSQILGMVAAGEALKDAGYGPDKEWNREKVSVILGVTGTLELVIPLGARLGHPLWRKALQEAGVDSSTTEEVVQRIGDSYVPWQEASFPGLLGNVVAGRISKQYDLGGTNCVVDAACASSLSALHLAGLELTAGRSDMVVTGGVDTFNDIFMYMCFSKTPALSPSGSARPFDAKGDGTTLGEGLGMVVLKRLADAERDGDRIYAVVRGVGSSSDGKGDAIYAPSAAGQQKALRAAYREANVTPDSIELVEAHGTGTKVGDAVEVSALRQVYGEADRPWCALGSVKSQIGHTKAAAGAAGLIKAALALHNKVLPPTIKVDEPLPEVTSGRTPFYINADKRPWLPTSGHPRRAAVSAFGFGGSNFHCVLEEYQPRKSAADWDGDVQILSFSAADRAGLIGLLDTIPAEMSWSATRKLAASSRAAFDPALECRLALVVERNGTALAAVVKKVRTLLDNDSVTSWVNPDGSCFSSSSAAGSLALLFPGQGAQYTGMLKDLACHFPEMLDSLEAADRVFTQQGARLSDLIYPPAPFAAEAKAAQELALTDTATAQPAIGAVSLGAYHILRKFGILPDVTAGHSYGELTALCAAGRLSEPDLHHISGIRGRLMGRSNGDSGLMLAVAAPLAIVEKFVTDRNLDLVIANKNAPDQAVLSGNSAEIARAAELCAAQGLTCKPLPVAAAFHSPLVSDASGPFLDALQGVTIGAGFIPVYANSTAFPYPADIAAARDLLGNQLARPVEFVAQVEAMYEAGCRTFLEVGPGARLTGLVKAILGERPHTALALDSSAGKRSGLVDLARVLAGLAVLGHRVDLTLWDGDFITAAAPMKKPAMTVPILGCNYVKPRPQRPPVERLAEPRSPQPATAVREKTADVSRSPAAPASHLAEALRISRDSMAALQKLHEQTANLHRQFLEGQEAAGRTIQALLEQQQRLMACNIPGTAVPAAFLAPEREPAPIAAPIPTPQAPAAVVAMPISAPPSGRAEQVLLEVISERTGYPVEMLELDMALDADLGIDSIKRVEILSVLQERLPEAPAVKPEHLGTLQTLRQIVAHLEAGIAPAAAVDTIAPPAAVPAAPIAAGRAEQILLEVISERTGYPVEMLEFDMALDADLGIDSIKRVEILSILQERLPEAPAVKPEHLGTLQTLRQIVAHLERVEAAPPEAATAVPAAPATATANPSITGGIERSVLVTVPLDTSVRRTHLAVPVGTEIWITSNGSSLPERIGQLLQAHGYRPRLISAGEWDTVGAPARLGGLLIVAPADGTDGSFFRDSFALLQKSAAALKASGAEGGATFVTVSRLDGHFGLARTGNLTDPLSGGLAGLAKTAHREWPDVHCKALDLAGDLGDVDVAAAAVVEEMFLSGPREVGIGIEGRFVPELVKAPLPEIADPEPISGTVVISGGGRGVTAEIAIAIAEQYHSGLLLLGRSPEPAPEPEWLAPLTDEGIIKKAVLEQLGKMSPKQLEERFRSLMANRELLRTLERIEAAGSQVLYRSLDIRDRTAVEEAVADARARTGAITGLIHGAGVLADRRIEEKTSEQFDQVYGTKVDGLQALLDAVAQDDLRFMAFFSSSTGRFGRIGQSDYAISNEILNKMAQQQSRLRPGCRVVSINWGPWDGGMVTPSLKKMFTEEGVGIIELAPGADHLLREIAQPPGAPVESIVIGATEKEEVVILPSKPAEALTLAVQIDLSIDRYPFLASHVINGKAVLPMAMIAEWMGHGALHNNPGFRLHGFNDLRVLKGVLFDQDKPCSIRILTGKARKRDAFHTVPVELVSSSEDREMLHARAEILLATRLPEGIRSITEIPARSYPHQDGEFYSQGILFHGPHLQGIIQVDACSPEGIVASVKPAPHPREWITEPLRNSWLTDPLAIDCAFQLMILWSFERSGKASLPCFAGRYRQFQDSFPRDGVQIIIQVTRENEQSATADMEFFDRQTGKLVARLEGYECVIDASLNSAFRRNRLPQHDRVKLGAA